MANKHLSIKPKKIKVLGIAIDAWRYEEPEGIAVVIDTGKITAQALIPWSTIRAALRRKDIRENTS